MADEIINRVTKSPLEVFDLEDFYPTERRVLFDLKDFLFEGLILREKDFREQLENHPWTDYSDCFVAIDNSADAIVPAWAFMLVASKLQPYAKKVVQGNLTDLENSVFQEIISEIDFSYLEGKPVIIKGCSKKPIPENAYVLALQKIQPIAKSIMYGEACSTVPIFKRK
ncbi:DUF2480 family protein [Capnocytophaga felis]|uniref:DUF2480 domain-containing protein n=1 Tax=Capnocytophaga felis TaxID=2267611 RepID=A0A5M4BAM0_9FLAO|nr:DUF2480 family protein [Capnocytophaga felis]GET46641.1 hypothetical protein RCZ01_19430 [Capnocytophaga felis]GET48743.1 hypothetical protein RCZ02_15740 [Capnocytophaga felis]